ncbi:uncharacterized protein LOC144168969 [Haemaphysalis longicornis]
MGRRHAYTLSAVSNGHAAAQAAGPGTAPGIKFPPSVVVLDCRSLEQRQQQHGGDETALLKELSEDGYTPRDRMVGWSCMFLAASFFLISAGGAMLALSSILESERHSLTAHYYINTSVLGGALLVLGECFILLAIFKGIWHGHL